MTLDVSAYPFVAIALGVLALLIFEAGLWMRRRRK